MLDGLLGRNGFSSKCKSLIKPTRTRIAVLRRREEAKQRFLKEDLAKLLANGLDVNAYGRTEEFIAGLNLFSCYTFIDQSCEYILKQLSVMQKLGQCPEECRETVASLMFAAARFSDLPELRDLRDSFKERYGNGLECYVNQVFVEKLASKPPVVEKRIKLLQDIAAEFLIQWDAKGFKQRMDKPSALPQKLGSLIVTDDEYNPPNGNNVFRKHEQRSKERVEQGPTLHDDEIVNIRRKDVLDGPVFKRDEHRKERIEHHDDTNVYGKRKDVLDGPVFKRDEHRIERIEHHDDKNVYGKRKDVLDGPVFKIDEHRKETIENHDDTNVYGKRKGVLDGPVSRRDEHRKERIQHHDDTIVYGKRRDVLDGPVSRRDEHHKEKIEHHNDGNVYGRWKEAPETNKKHMSKTENGENSMGKVKEGKTDYLLNGKSSDKEDGQKSTGRVKEEDQVRAKSAYNSPLPLPPPYVKLNIPPPYSKPLNASAAEKMKKQAEDLNDIIPLPKPKSVRRKHSKSASFSHDDDIGSSQDVHIVKRISSSRRKDRKGLQILFDDEQYQYHGHSLSRGHQDKEEKMMDKLLLHYSKKPSAYDIRKLRRKKTQPDTNPSSSKSPSPHHNGVEITVPPTRSISLPHEQSGESEGKKVYARANSFQPDNQAKHVHPKLPDYDDLAARFTALRGR